VKARCICYRSPCVWWSPHARRPIFSRWLRDLPRFRVDKSS